ncbi:MAG TPA: hypothetical protein VGM29_04535, partial [Polyangiaceae bacterium]
MSDAVGGTWIDFHGIPIELAYAPLSEDAFGTLFAPFPRIGRMSGALRIELATTEIACAGPSDAFRPCFFYGVAQGYARGDCYALYDGQSLINVEPVAGRMSGTLFRPDPAAVSAGMQHIALSLLLRERSIFDAHAAVACDDDRAFLLVGDSGSGKTTTLLGLLDAGFKFLGDDRVLLRPQDGLPELLAYPREFHVTPKTLAALATQPDAQTPLHQDGRFRIGPLEQWSASFRRSWNGPMTLIFPEVVNDPSSHLCRVSPAESFGHLLASSAAVALPTTRYADEQMGVLKDIA